MRQILVIICFFIIKDQALGQIFTCRDGYSKFTSEAPLEVIKAESNDVNGILDCNSKNVAFSIDIISFEGFNSALQKEHFRENYMEVDKYPKATFKGKIIEDIDLKKGGTTMVRAKGVLNIHGTEKEKIVKVKITSKEKQIAIESDFEVPLEDHNIKIPKVVNQKIASVITVNIKATLKPKG
jgi:polyisoprenoid-binding protein YceI